MAKGCDFMRRNNGIYALDIVEYQGKNFHVEKVENGKCKLIGEDGCILEDVDVFQCKKVIME